MKLQIRGGTFAYDGKEPIFENLDFSVESGEILTILGRNGIGKTTLLKCINGIYTWTKGGMYIDAKAVKPVQNLPIGYVPQAGTLAFPYTIEELVMMGRTRHLGMFSTPGKKDKEIVATCLEKVGISHLANRVATKLSGGQLQLALIARALASEPEIIIMDEPEAHLDFKNQFMMLKLIHTIVKENNLACIMNTHYPAHALQISDTSLLLKPKKYLFGKTCDIVCEKNLNDYFDVESKVIVGNEQGSTYVAFTIWNVKT